MSGFTRRAPRISRNIILDQVSVSEFGGRECVLGRDRLTGEAIRAGLKRRHVARQTRLAELSAGLGEEGSLLLRDCLLDANGGWEAAYATPVKAGQNLVQLADWTHISDAHTVLQDRRIHDVHSLLPEAMEDVHDTQSLRDSLVRLLSRIPGETASRIDVMVRGWDRRDDYMRAFWVQGPDAASGMDAEVAIERFEARLTKPFSPQQASHSYPGVSLLRRACALMEERGDGMIWQCIPAEVRSISSWAGQPEASESFHDGSGNPLASQSILFFNIREGMPYLNKVIPVSSDGNVPLSLVEHPNSGLQLESDAFPSSPWGQPDSMTAEADPEELTRYMLESAQRFEALR